MQDPVLLCGDGNTYERIAVQQWLDAGRKHSPLTGQELCGEQGTLLVPNMAIRRMIADFVIT